MKDLKAIYFYENSNSEPIKCDMFVTADDSDVQIYSQLVNMSNESAGSNIERENFKYMLVAMHYFDLLEDGYPYEQLDALLQKEYDNTTIKSKLEAIRAQSYLCDAVATQKNFVQVGLRTFYQALMKKDFMIEEYNQYGYKRKSRG